MWFLGVRFLELVLLRLVLWVGLPVGLMVLLVGPKRVWRGLGRAWNWLTNRREDPEAIIDRVVREHTDHVTAVRKALRQAEQTTAKVEENKQTTEANIADLERQAREAVGRGDDLGARATLYKLNLERAALENFQNQLERLKQHIDETQRRLYLLELQLRQYEVGRSILLSELAEAKTVEQQYAIANRFDPFSAVSNWQRAEGMVQEKSLSAQAAERVQADTADLVVSAGEGAIDPVILDAQLQELKSIIREATAEKPAAATDSPIRRKETTR